MIEIRIKMPKELREKYPVYYSETIDLIQSIFPGYRFSRGGRKPSDNNTIEYIMILEKK